LDDFVENVLIDMHAKCGSIENAWYLLYKTKSDGTQSLLDMNIIDMLVRPSSYEKILQKGIKLESKRFYSVLPSYACHFGSSRIGHGDSLTNKGSDFEMNVFLGSALERMHVKCGSIQTASDMFEKIP
jgi:hypothetical protein